MTSKCAFGCGESGDLGQMQSAKNKPLAEWLMVLPQRLHKVWVLLWRLPKDEVPFAVCVSVAALEHQLASDWKPTHLELVCLMDQVS